METKKTGLALLREPFPKHQISTLPKPTTKDGKKGKCQECGGFHVLPAIHLDYVGHAALTDRLLDADPNWNWEPLATKDGLPAFDSTGGLWIKLTVCNVSRLGYGNAEKSNFGEPGNREKEVIGDALRNAAMRFGAALDLWHKGALHKRTEPQAQAQNNQPKPAPPKYDEWAPIDAPLASEPGFESMEPFTIEPGPRQNSPEPKREISDKQIGRFWGMTKALKWSNEDAHTHIKQKTGKESVKLLTKKEYSEITAALQIEIDKNAHNNI